MKPAVTRSAIETTNPARGGTWDDYLRYRDELGLEEQTLRMYIVPEEGESFDDYRDRIAETLGGGKIKRWLIRRALKNEIPFTFTLREKTRGDLLRVSTTVSRDMYEGTIQGSGRYEHRSSRIAQEICKFLDEQNVSYDLRELERLLG